MEVFAGLGWNNACGRIKMENPTEQIDVMNEAKVEAKVEAFKYFFWWAVVTFWLMYYNDVPSTRKIARGLIIAVAIVLGMFVPIGHRTDAFFLALPLYYGAEGYVVGWYLVVNMVFVAIGIQPLAENKSKVDKSKADKSTTNTSGEKNADDHDMYGGSAECKAAVSAWYASLLTKDVEPEDWEKAFADVPDDEVVRGVSINIRRISLILTAKNNFSRFLPKSLIIPAIADPEKPYLDTCSFGSDQNSTASFSIFGRLFKARITYTVSEMPVPDDSEHPPPTARDFVGVATITFAPPIRGMDLKMGLKNAIPFI